jgi:2-haloacid dehalogenase
VTASAVGRVAPAGAQESKSGAVTPSILAFDVNDSLLDIWYLAPLFQRLFGDGKFVNEWYTTLILYSQAITLAGGPYIPFFNLAEAVLKSMGSIHSVSIQQADIVELGMRSATMPAHADVPVGLKQLKDAGFRLITLSNSPQGVQIAQLRHAGIEGYFERLLSADLVRRFKPAPQMYHMAAEECLYRRQRFACCRLICGIISGRRMLAVRQHLSPDWAMLRRPHWRCLGGRSQQSSDRTFRAWQRN